MDRHSRLSFRPRRDVRLADSSIAPARGSRGRGPLVVEKNPINQKVVTAVLRARLRRRVAANGQEALDALARQRFALILMDVQMPRLTA